MANTSLDEPAFAPCWRTWRSITSKHLVLCSWDQVPHLSKAACDELWTSYPEHEREARAKGIPVLGSGKIYPFPEKDFVVTDFPIPDHWVRGYGLDVGWKRTAALWGAWDRDGTDCLYIYAEYYRGEVEATIHAAAIKAKGDWIPGVCDPAAEQANQVDGRRFVDELRKQPLGLKNLSLAEPKLVSSGIMLVHDRFSTGRLKIFRSCSNFLEELRLYRRAENGQIVKERDHLCDSCRYLVTDGMQRMRTRPAPEKERPVSAAYSGDRGWMA